MAFSGTLRSVGILVAAACHVLGESASAAGDSGKPRGVKRRCAPEVTGVWTCDLRKCHRDLRASYVVMLLDGKHRGHTCTCCSMLRPASGRCCRELDCVDQTPGRSECGLQCGAVFTREDRTIKGCLQNTEDAECFVSGISYSGHDLFQIRDGEADTAHDCQEFCQELQDCEFFTFDSNKKACYLKDRDAPEGRKKVVDYFVTGPKYCEGAAPTSGTPGCYDSGIAFKGHDLEPSGESGVESVEECQVHCQEHADCHYFTYVSSEDVCYLKDVDAPEGEAVVEEHIISGPKYCGPRSTSPPAAGELGPQPLPVSSPVASCFESGTVYDGHTLHRDLDGSVESPDDCQTLCQYIQGCAYFTFVASSKACYLKDRSALAGRRKVSDETTVSGPRRCDPPLPSPTPREPEPPTSVPPTQDGTNRGIDLHKGSAVEVTAEKSPERFTVTVGSCYTITVDKDAKELQVKGTRTHKGKFPTEPLKNGAFGLLIYPEGERLAAVYDYQTAGGDWGSMTVRTPSSPCSLLQVALTGIPANEVFEGVRAFLTDDMKNLGS